MKPFLAKVEQLAKGQEVGNILGAPVAIIEVPMSVE